MKIGVIGTGNMGTILVEALVESKAVEQTDLFVTNRSVGKVNGLKERFQGIQPIKSNLEIAQLTDLIFVCVKPKDIYNVLLTIKPLLNKEQCVVSITSPISVSQLEQYIECSCARLIPSITNRALSGVSLISFGQSCSGYWKNFIHELSTKISIPIEIENEITRISSDIVSCGPAFFSYLAQEFINAACRQTSIDKKTATVLTEKMFIGFGELLKKGHYSLPTLQEKVCVKGGITGEGIKVLEAELGEVFDHLIQATHRKFNEDIEEIEEQFGVKY
ncbi:late competence protein ComER [Peribacillus alkalitolerans]|uniref:late competence protein ComER n=1 Tax=Peribacillus alkalitolerans TaxID=1550385 RepID=UPI0013D2951F|nr:late competence protein ComER [Peribacillus alkalitolerans]